MKINARGYKSGFPVTVLSPLMHSALIFLIPARHSNQRTMTETLSLKIVVCLLKNRIIYFSKNTEEKCYPIFSNSIGGSARKNISRLFYQIKNLALNSIIFMIGCFR